ncbi:MAG: phosphoenolpyruvate synthase [Acidobacteria bacterium]|nr:phosphoenolpyruvate synthase [Acidobacteriota bacterium]
MFDRTATRTSDSSTHFDAVADCPSDAATATASDAAYVAPLRALGAGSLPLAGGKAANLGSMLQAGLPVPGGFCVTTAAYAAVADTTGIGDVIARLAGVPPDDTAALAALAGEARRLFLAAPMPASVAEAVRASYQDVSREDTAQADPARTGHAEPTLARVAVRSSATAEDLPTASFAGQQDTYLNIVGEDALLDAVRRCWASLWTDRAVTYRAANGIDHGAVRLAVVVQRMVQASVAGVLFTANPLTGHRGQMVADASPGLGEAVVSGAVNPDHWVLDAATGARLDTRLGDKRVVIRSVAGGGTEHVTQDDGSTQACLTDAQLRALAALGRQVQAHFGRPQDIEFAFDDAGRCWLVQARPITTLYPLPPTAPAPDDGLRVYFSVNVAQGVFRPITPMGIQVFRLLAGSLATAFGFPPSDSYAGPATLQEAGHRAFLDVTPALRHPFGRRLLLFALHFGENRAGKLVAGLLDDPRLAASGSTRSTLAHIAGVARRQGVPGRILGGLADPAAARAKALASARREVALAAPLPADTPPLARLDAIERWFTTGPARLWFDILPLAGTGFLSRALATRLLGDRVTDEELERVVRAVPHNPTTEMDLALWALAQALRADAASAATLLGRPAADLAAAYAAGTLPAALQRGLADFLATWGARGVAEIDTGLPRWEEEPTHILGVLANYLRLDDQGKAPDAVFAAGAAEAEATIGDLARRAGPLRGWLVRALLQRTRALVGLREWPKYYFVVISARIRASLRLVGADLAAAGRLDHADDIFFVTLPEARAGLAGSDLRPVVAARRESYDRELSRRHVPRLLLSNGVEPTPAASPHDEANGAFHGTPASSGVVRGRARVILDPVGAHLEPGEILGAPSTDPGWTPLFLTAAGLVMEMGGSMSHGSVVAREYGIPAVVGVEGASTRFRTGQMIEVDGGEGVVRIIPDGA